jgi:hypothetical protein
MNIESPLLRKNVPCLFFNTAADGNGTTIVLLDLSAAFDTIDHEVLLDRLNGYCGLTGPALSWFTFYLRCQTQVVKIGSVSSQTIDIRFGVPQGSVLVGTLLFAIYICQLPSVTGTDGVIIDGFFLTTLKPELDYLLLKIPLLPPSPPPLSLLSKWCLNCERFYLENRVKLNIDKTVYFLAAPKNKLHLLPDTPLTVGSLEISPVTKCRNLVPESYSTLGLQWSAK